MALEDGANTAYGGDPAGRAQVSLLTVLLRRAPIIIVVTLLCAGAAAALAYSNRDSYESTAKLLFRQTIGPEQAAQGLIPGAPDADNLAQNNVAVVDSRRVALETAKQLGDVSADEVEDDVVVAGQKDSDVVNVTATASSPERAAELANAYAETAESQARADQRRRTLANLQSVTRQLRRLSPEQRRGQAGSDLRSRQNTLRTLADAGVGSPQIIQPAYPPEDKTGRPVETILLGVLFGLILGVGLALLRDQMDRRLHQIADVSSAFDASVLATVPRHRKLKRHVPFSELPADVAEAFRMLQMNLRFGPGPPVRSVLVTSSRAGEGKTTVAWNLACAAASSGLSVTLVEADLRRPRLAERYGLDAAPGLSEVLRGEVLIANALQSVSTAAGEPGTNGHLRSLNVLTAGDPPPDPWALMQSSAMVRVLETVSRDLLIIDTPPIPYVADAIALVRRVDGVLICASVDSTSGEEAAGLRDQLRSLDAWVVGVVANGGSGATGYAYAAPSAGLDWSPPVPGTGRFPAPRSGRLEKRSEDVPSGRA